MKRALLYSLLYFVTLGCGVSAEADPNALLEFTLRGDGNTATFTLPSSPTPSGFAEQCSFNEATFCQLSTPVIVNGKLVTLTTTFYANGGMALADGASKPIIDTIGVPLFAGTLQHPIFSPGEYSLEGVGLRSVATAYTLTITKQKH